MQGSQKKSVFCVAKFDIFDRLPSVIQADAIKQSNRVKTSHQIPSVKEAVMDVGSDLKETSEYSSNSELYFERETAVPDFEREVVYDVDSFGKKSTRSEKMLAPPPDFQKSLKALSPDLQKSFKTILNGDIVGIWPIKQEFLLK